jgi:heme-degrading monooxygenase HmoA
MIPIDQAFAANHVAGNQETVMFVALSRFTIANGMAAEVREAFRTRPHLVDRERGFIGMQVMSPVDVPEEIWLVTQWADEGSYREWHRGHHYHQSHAGIPKGLKLVPKSAGITFFDLFAT